MLSAHDMRAVERLFREEPLRKDAFMREDIALYKRAFGTKSGFTGPINYCRALFRSPNASHWVQHDEPDRVIELILEFLTPDP